MSKWIRNKMESMAQAIPDNDQIIEKMCSGFELPMPYETKSYQQFDPIRHGELEIKAVVITFTPSAG